MTRMLTAGLAALTVAGGAWGQGPVEPPPGALPPAEVVPAQSTQPAAGGSPAPERATTGSPGPSTGPTFTARWNNGLFFEAADKSFTAHVGGTVHYDAAWYTAQPSLTKSPGGTGVFNDGVNMRRGRLFAEGTIAKDFDYKFEIEFANGFSPAGLSVPAAAGTVSNSPGPTDAWMQWKSIPVLGTLRVGNQKEPFSLEHLENYRLLGFMERSYLFDAGQATAFNNGFSPGVSLFNTWAEDRVYTAGGFFKNESDLIGFGQNDGNYAATGRVGFLPVYRPDDPCVWYVGGAASHRDPVGGAVQVRIRNDVRNGPFPLLNLLANTGTITASSQTLYNLETAVAYGSFWAQGEYLVNLVNDARTSAAGPDLGTARFQGFYAASGVLLTGESRTWNPKSATWNRIVPRHNLGFGDECGGGGGVGAVELASRYSQFDASDKGIDGGRLRAVTVGLNWYWNPNMKMQFNYDYVYRDEASNPLAKGQVHSFGTRAAFDF